MYIGIPKEIKSDEYRVAMIPAEVEYLTRHGHKVAVETQAGSGSGSRTSLSAGCHSPYHNSA